MNPGVQDVRADAPDPLYERLTAYAGRPAATASSGKDPVNAPMIRHWCEAMGDTSPAYRGPGAVAPPTMLQAWTMRGLSPGPEPDDGTGRSPAYDGLLRLLDGAGYTSVVATDCEQEYLQPLRPGDLITYDSVIESVSPRKTTKLGTGYFVTTRMNVRANGEPAGPTASASSSTGPSSAPPSGRCPSAPAPSSTATTPDSGPE